MPTKEAFLGFNILAAWIALSFPLDIMNFPLEDMPEIFFPTSFSLTSLCFVGNSTKLDISFSFKMSWLDVFVSSKSIMST